MGEKEERKRGERGREREDKERKIERKERESEEVRGRGEKARERGERERVREGVREIAREERGGWGETEIEYVSSVFNRIGFDKLKT